MELKDKKMKCKECQAEFVFTKGEQQFYLQKAYAEPCRCPECRKARKKDRRKKRRTLIRSLKAAEDVKIEVATAIGEQGVTVQKEAVSMGLAPADPAPAPAPKPAKKGKKA